MSCEKGKRDQTRATRTTVIPFARVSSLLPGSVCPHELLVLRSLLANMLSVTKRIYSLHQKTNPLARKNAYWHDNALTWTSELPAMLFRTDHYRPNSMH